jgi:hypothetical protein
MPPKRHGAPARAPKATPRRESVRSRRENVWIPLGLRFDPPATSYIGPWSWQSARSERPSAGERVTADGEVPLLDIICIVGILALGAIVALIGKGVEKL